MLPLSFQGRLPHTWDMPISQNAVHVIGAGLAGSERPQLAEAGVPVVLHEMRPARMTPAHTSGCLAELVCSNSFRSDDTERSAIGLLHAEMRRLGSLILACADAAAGAGRRCAGRRSRGFRAGVEAAIAGASTDPR